MKQHTSLQLEINRADEIDNYDTYYSSVSDFSFMDVISTLIEDISYPVFVVKDGSRYVYALNQAAKEGLPPTLLDEVVIDDLLQVHNSLLNDQPIVFFNKQWYLINSDTFEAGDETYEKIELKVHSAVPDAITLNRWKHMVAVMLHRFRSPLTGISGYLDLLMEGTLDSKTQERATKIEEGVTHLANLMDELEYFYHIPSEFDESKLEPVQLEPILNRIKLGLSEKDRSRIQYLKPADSTALQATEDSLERVLQLLVKNAVTYSDEKSPVIISKLSNKSIRISNKGEPIKSSICDHIFHPFVTSQANNLGIGLTMALLFSRHFGGTIFQTENGENGRISFTICFP